MYSWNWNCNSFLIVLLAGVVSAEPQKHGGIWVCYCVLMARSCLFLFLYSWKDKEFYFFLIALDDDCQQRSETPERQEGVRWLAVPSCIDGAVLLCWDGQCVQKG